MNFIFFWEKTIYFDSLKTKQYVIDNDNIRTDLPEFLFVKLNNNWGIIDVNNECLTGFIFDKADVNSDEVPYYVYYYQYQKTSGIFSRRKTIYEPRLKE